MQERFERHRQPWRQDEIQKLHTLAGKGMALKAIAKALVRSEELIKQRAKEDGLEDCQAPVDCFVLVHGASESLDLVAFGNLSID